MYKSGRDNIPWKRGSRIHSSEEHHPEFANFSTLFLVTLIDSSVISKNKTAIFHPQVNTLCQGHFMYSKFFTNLGKKQNTLGMRFKL